jgi:FKBP-type peptidyl-prolyl cis-trans isomerase SlyD
MAIEKNKIVSLIYDLKESSFEGKIIESLDEEKPLTFLYGSGKLLLVFESKILSLNKGDQFKFTLNPDMAYGEKREEMILNVPISVFQVDGKIDGEICMVGNEVPMMDSEGNPLSGIIIEITDTYVKMDFNHPLAGLDLFFSGKIIDIRDATEVEITELNNSCSSCGSSNTRSACKGSCG